MSTLLLIYLVQNTQEIKRMLSNLDETGQSVQSFEEVLFFKYVQLKNRKNKRLIQIFLCQLDLGGLGKEKGLFLLPASHIQLTQDKLNEFFVFLFLCCI